MNQNDERYGGIVDNFIDKILKQYGITEEHINKVKNLLDNIDVFDYDDKTVIRLSLKDIRIEIEK